MERGHEWFEQLTNEIVKKRFSHGRLIREWRPRKDGVRTEALDCRVYAYAALRALVRNYRFNLDYSAEQMATAEPRKADKQQTEQPNTTTPKGRSVRSKGIDL